jgi:hypothetical protein
MELFGPIVSHFGNYVVNPYLIAKCISFRKIKGDSAFFMHGLYLVRGSRFPYGNFLVIFMAFST